MPTLNVSEETKRIMDEVRHKGESDDALIRRLIEEAGARIKGSWATTRAGPDPFSPPTPRTPDTPPPAPPTDIPPPGVGRRRTA